MEKYELKMTTSWNRETFSKKKRLDISFILPSKNQKPDGQSDDNCQSEPNWKSHEDEHKTVGKGQLEEVEGGLGEVRCGEEAGDVTEALSVCFFYRKPPKWKSDE